MYNGFVRLFGKHVLITESNLCPSPFTGIGNGLVVTLNPVLIHQHFKHQKATATGIAYAGASVGSFALPPLIEYLLGAYGFKGCFLLLGAILLNGLVPAFIAKSPAPTPVVANKKRINGKLVLMDPKSLNGGLSHVEVGSLISKFSYCNFWIGLGFCCFEAN